MPCFRRNRGAGKEGKNSKHNHPKMPNHPLTGKSTERGASGSEKVEERGDYTEHEARAKAFAEGLSLPRSFL